jgi:hypothetical protein
MNAPATALADEAARIAAMTRTTLALVEAGRRLGKTAVMAGRVALLACRGAGARSIGR